VNPVIAICGRTTLESQLLLRLAGFQHIYPLTELELILLKGARKRFYADKCENG
jgi:hypothetical protein